MRLESLRWKKLQFKLQTTEILKDEIKKKIN